MPRITVITPVFNGIDFIDRCVGNVQDQGFPELEHLVVDGGSADGTAERLRQLSLTYPNLRFVSEKDRGQSDAMNKGVRMSSSGLIGILNVDDFYEPNAIREAVTFLETHPRCDMVVGDCNILNAEGRLEWVNRPKDLRLESLLLGWRFAEHPVNPSAYFYRKSIHEKVGDFKLTEHFMMDIHFIYDCAAMVRMQYVPKIWGNFRHRAGAKTVSNWANIPSEMREIREEKIAGLSRLARLRMGLRWRQISAMRTLRKWTGKAAEN